MLEKLVLLALLILAPAYFLRRSWQCARQFRNFCERTSLEDGRASDFESKEVLDGGFFNGYEAEHYRNLRSGQFSHYERLGMLSEAKGISREIRSISFGLAIYLVCFGFFVVFVL